MASSSHSIKTHRLTPADCANTTTTLRDGGGLMLQVTPLVGGNGYARSWVFRYSFKNRDYMLGLGSLERITLDEARVLVARYRKNWLDQGINPKVKLAETKAEERRKAEEAVAKAAANEATAKGELVTFRQACELYSKLPAIRNNWTNADYEWQWFRQLEVHIFPKLGDVPVANIDRRKVLEVLEPIWGSKTIADVRGRIEKVLDWCEGKGWRPEGLLNPAAKAALTKAGLPAPRKGAHAVVAHPALPYEDVRAFIAALRKEDCIPARAVEVLIRTSVRTGDLRFARWCEIDLDKRLWTIPRGRMKMRHDTEDRIDHQVPLSEPVIRILMGLKSDHKPTDYIFTNGHGRPLYEPAMLRQCRKIRSDVSVHGFRSTFRDWCGDMTEHDSQTAELALAHKVKGVEGRYRRKTALEKRRDLMIRWSQYCDGESNVVPLKKAV